MNGGVTCGVAFMALLLAMAICAALKGFEAAGIADLEVGQVWQSTHQYQGHTYTNRLTMMDVGEMNTVTMLETWLGISTNRMIDTRRLRVNLASLLFNWELIQE